MQLSLLGHDLNGFYQLALIHQRRLTLFYWGQDLLMALIQTYTTSLSRLLESDNLLPYPSYNLIWGWTVMDTVPKRRK
jgi:hypothetical protein